MLMNFSSTLCIFVFEVLLLGDENGCSPLHHACSVDVVDTIEIILDAAAEADEKLLEDVVMKKDNEGEFGGDISPIKDTSIVLSHQSAPGSIQTNPSNLTGLLVLLVLQ